ncbi:hypothetical protein HHK36_027558 [Tetracentron sinense]|uniref:WRKY domain-containing protein n=1 Tax=Tetracentron sinense TaxID=13715 RepID=A0A834YE90_TETSI|nr:hypothetical protein HHK36_027558 [Tetracentron sinense]
MENVENWDQKSLINELSQGMELAKQLRTHLDPSSSHQTREFLVEKILSSFEKAISMLKWRPSAGEPTVESPRSVSGSPRSHDSGQVFKDQDHKDVSKKRKILPRWTEQVRVCLENGTEGPLDDGYSWRKYGQKDILGAKHPRGYYRCTHRHVQGCLATKQVQRSDEDPSIFEISYRGKHTCSQASHLVPAYASPRKQETKKNTDHHQQQQQKQQKSQEILLNFQTGLRVQSDLDTQEHTFPPFSFPSTPIGCIKSENHIFSPSTLDTSFMGSISPSFISPATSESNFSMPWCQMNSYGGGHNLQTSESDLTEIISATTSGTNSPILDLDFALDPVEFDPNFPFDTPGFFS